MKKVMVKAFVASIACLMLAMPFSAKGPINAGGESLIVPFNPTAMINSLMAIMPLVYPNLGSPTTIYEGDVTITVSQIPIAICDWDTMECDGTWIQLKWSRAYEAATNPDVPYWTGEWTKQAWCHYKFWMNGAEPVVTITREYGGETIDTEDVTEHIFFKVQWVGGGEGNSDFDIGRNFDIKIVSYK